MRIWYMQNIVLCQIFGSDFLHALSGSLTQIKIWKHPFWLIRICKLKSDMVRFQKQKKKTIPTIQHWVKKSMIYPTFILGEKEKLCDNRREIYKRQKICLTNVLWPFKGSTWFLDMFIKPAFPRVAVKFLRKQVWTCFIHLWVRY